MEPLLNVKFIDHYYSDDDTKEQAVDCLKSYLLKQSNFSQETLHQAFSLTVVSLRDFDHLIAKTKEKIYELLEVLGKSAKQLPLEKAFCYFKEIEVRLIRLKEALVGADTDLSREIVIARVASLYFSSLSEPAKKCLFHLKEMCALPNTLSFINRTNKEKVESIFKSFPFENPEIKKTQDEQIVKILQESLTTPRKMKPASKDFKDSLFSNLKKISDIFQEEKMVQPSVLNEGMFILCASRKLEDKDERMISDDILKSQQIKNDQIKKIQVVIEKLIEAHCPLLFPQSDTPLKEYVRSEIQSLFPEIIKKMFFNEPQGVSDKHKVIVHSMLAKISEFMALLSGTSPGSKSSEEIALILCEKMKIHGDQLKEKLHFLLYKALQKILFPQSSKAFPYLMSAEDNLKVMWTSLLCEKALEVVLSPENIMKALMRIFTVPVDMDNLDTKGPPLSAFAIEDDAFARPISHLIKNTILSFVHLEPAEGYAATVIYGLEKLLEVKELEIGNMVLKGMAKILSSECSMTPLLLIYHVFLFEEGSKLKPTFSSETRSECNIEDHIFKCIMPQINSALKSKSDLAAWVASGKSFDAHVKKLISIMVKLLQNETILKLFFIHHLKGVIEILEG